jgi:hypothetical protein
MVFVSVIGQEIAYMVLSTRMGVRESLRRRQTVWPLYNGGSDEQE